MAKGTSGNQKKMTKKQYWNIRKIRMHKGKSKNIAAQTFSFLLEFSRLYLADEAKTMIQFSMYIEKMFDNLL